MNRAVRMMVLTGVTSVSIGTTALIATAAEAAPNGSAAQHANSHSAVVQATATSAVAPAPAPAASTSGSSASVSSTTIAGSGGAAHQIHTDPQPASNADFSGNGANVHGPYDSTRDGSPSLNGNGGGQAVGKPCAGCVGKADNKNPKGQLPGGSDHNNGYECDGNHGVGRSNPAHTGCTTAPVPSVPPAGGGAPTPGPGTSTPDVPTQSPSVPAEVPSDEPSPTNVINNPPVLVTGPVPASTSTPTHTTEIDALVSKAERPLANTGAPVRNGILAGLASLLAGTALTFGTRRRGAHS